MLNSLKMTDKQRGTFAANLSQMSELVKLVKLRKVRTTSNSLRGLSYGMKISKFFIYLILKN